MENIYSKLNRAIAFLEEHLFDEIDYREIAKILEMNITAKLYLNLSQIIRQASMFGSED